MNIFFGRFYKESTFELIKEIVHRYKPVNCIGIVENSGPTVKKFGEKVLDVYFNLIFTRRFLENENFIEHHLYAKAPPLDTKILNEMSTHEMELLQVMSRLQNAKRDFRNRKILYYQKVRFWNFILDEFSIDILIEEIMPHTCDDLIVFYLCKIKKIKTVLFENFPLKYIDKYYYFINDTKDNFLDLKKEYLNIKNKDNENDGILSKNFKPGFKKAFELYVEKKEKVLPDYMKKTAPYLVLWNSISDSIPLISRMKLCIYVSFQLLFQTKNYKLIECIKKELESRDYWREDIAAFHFYDMNKLKACFEDKYIYVPLHAEPECATLPKGGRYEEAILYISLLSKALPVGYYLYLKIHPTQRIRYKMYPFYHGISFYKHLLSLGNVKFIDETESTFDLIEHSIAVATVTGTAGFEAICRGKPCLLFGDAFYQYAPGVYRINTYQDCQKALSEILSINKNKIEERDLAIYFIAMQNIGCEFSNGEKHKNVFSVIFGILDRMNKGNSK